MENLLSVIFDDLTAGDFRANVEVSGRCCVIASSEDWMEVEGFSAPILFQRIVPKASQVNQVSGTTRERHRSEIAVATFCDAFLTIGKAGDYSEGTDIADLQSLLLADLKYARQLVFRLPAASPR